MKSTGIVRKVDELGRVVIPIELRRTQGIAIKDPLEIYVDEEYVIIQKYTPGCVFCDSATDVITYEDKTVCRECIESIKKSV